MSESQTEKERSMSLCLSVLPDCYPPLFCRCHGYSALSPPPSCWWIWRDGAGEKRWSWLYCPCVIFIPVQLRVAPPPLFPFFLLHSSLSSSNLHTARSPCICVCICICSSHFLSLLPPSLSLSLLAQFVFRAWLTQADFLERAWAQKRDKGKCGDGFLSETVSKGEKRRREKKMWCCRPVRRQKKEAYALMGELT